MSNETPSDPKDDATPHSAQPQAGESAAEAAAPQAGTPEADPLETVRAEAERFRDLAMRTQADFENYRKRAARERERALFREKVARLFVVGGVVNDYSRRGAEGERLPIDPRLKERNPERFGPEGDPRAADPVEGAALGALLTSGEAVIWLPRDICLWRYAAPQILSDGGEVCEFLIRELFYARLQALGPGADRYDAADAPVLLSALPALLLAVRPDPSLWLRLFRAVLARAEVDAAGSISDFVLKPENPNLYAVIAIDGRALGKLLTARLRDRPLVAEG